MKRQISTTMFVLEIIILTEIISHLINTFLHSLLDIENYLSVFLLIELSVPLIALFISVLIGCKIYALPASIYRLSFLIPLASLGLYLLFFTGMVTVLTSISIQTILTMIIASMTKGGAVITIIDTVVKGGVVYLSLRIFSQSNTTLSENPLS